MSSYELLRAKLQTRQDELMRRLGKVGASLRQVPDADSQERAVELENDEVLVGLDAGSIAELAQIRAALARLDDGTYGVCTRCEEPIEFKRLEVLPFAATCVDCAD
ncbi:MAG: TraR/DksA family transcriptional regulator [Myxococcales bacterium]|nr:TraR/DksA family transcriptional regulator [Myxococcales bacterium]MDH5567687.1 TraR/DksA family transcriptional regulator [Myxococcales bacterium]